MTETYRYLTRNVRPSRSQLVSGAGLEVRDSTGQALLDLGSQTSNLVIGQSHPAVAEAAVDQVRRLLYASSSFGSQPFLALAQRLVGLAPDGLTAANLMMCNGSDAVETACKLARVYKGCPTLLAINGAWHGESIGTLAFSPAYKDSLLVTDRNVLLSAEPTLASLAELVEATPDAAGVIVDPIGVSNGLFTRDEIERYLPLIRQLCDERDIVLIFDEVQSFGGFLGTSLFAAQEFSVTPDVICMAKAVGGGLPLAGVLCQPKLAELLSHNEAEYTNGANPVSCAAALAYLDVFERERENFASNARAFQEAIEELAAACPEMEFRAHGVIATCRLRADRFRERWASRATKLAAAEGLILRITNFGQNVMLKPSLLIEPETSKAVAARLGEIFRAAADYAADCGQPMARLRAGLMVPGPAPAAEVGYLGGMLATLGDGVQAYARGDEQIVELTTRLPRIGVRVTRAFAPESAADGPLYEPVSGWALDDFLRHHRNLAEGEVNGILTQYLRALESAHANGIVIGGRRTRTAVIDSSLFVQLTDFAVAYRGEFATLAAFEELYALFDIGTHLADQAAGSRALRRAASAVFRRWPARASRAWQAIRAAHPGPVYRDIIALVDDVSIRQQA